jgi:hypothetical protein
MVGRLTYGAVFIFFVFDFGLFAALGRRFASIMGPADEGMRMPSLPPASITDADVDHVVVALVRAFTVLPCVSGLQLIVTVVDRIRLLGRSVAAAATAAATAATKCLWTLPIVPRTMSVY